MVREDEGGVRWGGSDVTLRGGRFARRLPVELIRLLHSNQCACRICTHRFPAVASKHILCIVNSLLTHDA